MKVVTRLLFLLFVFAASVVLFIGRMGIGGHAKKIETREIAEAVLPTISVVSDGVELGCLYGYSSNMDAVLDREDLIPIDASGTMELRIAEYDMTVRRLQYEIEDIVSLSVLDSGTMNAFEHDDFAKIARIKLKAELKEGTEYAVRITLVNNTGKRMYYYFRIKQYKETNLAEKIAFIKEFRNNTMSAVKSERDAIIPYLEMQSDAPNDTFGHLDIHSDYRLIAWGNLAPEEVTAPVVTVTEFYNEIMTAVVRSVVKVDIGYGEEYYLTEEKFRIRYLGSLIHLLNYERDVDTLFDVRTASLSQNDIKLGILSGTSHKLYASRDESGVAFVRNGSLYFYHTADNTVTTVFAATEEYKRLLGLQAGYDISVLKMEDDGNLTFMVSGYRSRGGYEGRVGIYVYRYYPKDNRLLELIYVPVNTTAQLLKEELGDFAYLSAQDVFFFMVDGSLYSYNLLTGQLDTVAHGIPEDGYVFSVEERFVAYQTEDDDESVCVLFPETGEKTFFTSSEGEYISLLGIQDSKLILGYGRRSDIVQNEDGSYTKAMYRAVICDTAHTVCKEYQKNGVFLEGVKSEGNVICLYRLGREDGMQYERLEPDYILIQDKENSQKIAMDIRVTEVLLKEHYISFPSEYVMEGIPRQKVVSNTVLDRDTTLRIAQLEPLKRKYYVYCYGRIVNVSTNPGEAILYADEAIGTVTSEDGKVVWERGIKANAAKAGKVTTIRATENAGSVSSAISMMLSYRGISTRLQDSDVNGPVATVLEKYSQSRVLAMTGITLDEALYYVWCGQPVMALLENGNAIVITEYTTRDIIYYDPASGKNVTADKEKAEKMLVNGGSRYFSFLRER